MCVFVCINNNRRSFNSDGATSRCTKDFTTMHNCTPKDKNVCACVCAYIQEFLCSLGFWLLSFTTFVMKCVLVGVCIYIYVRACVCLVKVNQVECERTGVANG